MTTIIEIQDIIQKLTKAKITQIDIAEALGCGRSNISLRSKSNSRLTFEEIKKIEQYFNISLNNQQTLQTDSDIINIPYWSELPEELKHPEYPYVLAQRVSIEKGWNVKPENLCIVPMVGDKLSKYWYPINDGDILIIDTSHNYIRGNGVYFATSRNNTRFWVREMQVLVNDDLEIKGFSPSGNNTRVLTRKELEEVDFKVIGKVIKNVSFRL